MASTSGAACLQELFLPGYNNTPRNPAASRNTWQLVSKEPNTQLQMSRLTAKHQGPRDENYTFRKPKGKPKPALNQAACWEQPVLHKKPCIIKGFPRSEAFPPRSIYTEALLRTKAIDLNRRPQIPAPGSRDPCPSAEAGSDVQKERKG